MPSESVRALACQRYVGFLFRSYLKWESLRDVCDVSSLVRFHKPTIVSGESFYPTDFMDILRTQILVHLETEYGCTGSGWFPEVECNVDPEAGVLSLSIWFTHGAEQKKERPSAQRQ